MGLPYVADLRTNLEDVPPQSEAFSLNFSAPVLKALDRIQLTGRYPKGAVLFVEQEPARRVFILSKGRVKLSMTSSEGKSVILRIAGSGEVLGLHAVILDQAYQATAEVLGPCEVNYVQREDFLRFLGENPEAALSAGRQLSRNYHIACEQVRAIGLAQSAMGKLAGFLLLWATKGQTGGHGTRVLLTLTHEEIGQMLCLSRETVTRTFGHFRRRQLVVSRGATVVIQNKAALEQFAGM